MENKSGLAITDSHIGTPTKIIQNRLRSTLSSIGRIYLEPTAASFTFEESSIEQVVSDVSSWCDVLDGFVSQAGGLEKAKNKTRSLFKYYFERMGLSVSPEFTDSILDGDVVEVFGTDGRRLFFNPELFDYSSYPPDVMFSTPFWRLYHRDPEITELIQMHAAQVFAGQIKSPFRPNVPIHVVTETDSLYRYSSRVEIKLFAPIYLGRAVVGGAALEKFTLLYS